MAKMHSRKKGKSASHKPIKQTKKDWVKYSNKEIEQLIVKLDKTGLTSSLIGIKLRDVYGIPDVRTLTNKKIKKILEENNAKHGLPEDLKNLITKDIRLMKHVELHKKDQTVKRGLQLTVSKINRLSKYYKREGILADDWKYDREKAKSLIE